MDLWTSQSNFGKQILLSAACTAIGLVLVIGLLDFRGFGANATAGFLLGVLLLLIGVAGLLAAGRQTVVVDPKGRCVTIEDSNRFRSKKRLIPFSDIVGISIGFLGKRSNYVMWYYLVLRLRSGEDYPLFAPGRFYKGGSDKSIVANWKQRLEEYLGQ